MILTASGLRDTMSSEKFNNSNVVIVDGGLLDNSNLHENLHDDTVYLTTSWYNEEYETNNAQNKTIMKWKATLFHVVEQ